MNIYTIKDRLAEEAGDLFIAVNDAVAKRNFRSAMKRAISPDEYQLIRLGTYDQKTLKIVVDPMPEAIDVSITPSVLEQ